MDDPSHDPVDHARTTRLHAGESLINGRSWPGYLLGLLSVIGVFRCLVAFATGHSHHGLIIGALAVVAAASCLLWLVAEHRRVRRVEERWHQQHPDVPRQRPAS